MKTFKTLEEAWKDLEQHMIKAGTIKDITPSHKAAFFAGAGAAIKILQNTSTEPLSDEALTIIGECSDFACREDN